MVDTEAPVTAMDESDAEQEVNSAPRPPWWLLESTHPLAELAKGYAECRTGDIMGAIQTFEGIAGNFPDHPYIALGVEEALKRIPQAIERHLAQEEWRPAAILAARLRNFGLAGEYHVRAAEVGEQNGDSGARCRRIRGRIRMLRRNRGPRPRGGLPAGCSSSAHAARTTPDLRIPRNADGRRMGCAGCHRRQ